MTNEMTADGRVSVAVYICTYRRNEMLRRLLDSFAVAALHSRDRVSVGIVVVDDNVDGRAREVVDSFPHEFELGLHYRHTGSGNISIARNTGLEACLEIADWSGMVDDDEVVVPTWFDEALDVQEATGADAVTGPVHIRYPQGSPQWLSDQPFATLGSPPPYENGAKVPVCSTGNSIIRSAFLRKHPEIRFREDLGKLGGEDMVFYMALGEVGLDARHATEMIAYGVEGMERSTLKYQLRSAFWLGNTEYVTNIEGGKATRFRLVLRGSKRLLTEALAPMQRLRRGRRPMFRHALAMASQSLGMLGGAVGVRLEHR